MEQASMTSLHSRFFLNARGSPPRRAPGLVQALRSRRRSGDVRVAGRDTAGTRRRRPGGDLAPRYASAA